MIVFCGLFVVSYSLFETGETRLTLDYYTRTCPNVLQIVRKEMECAVLSEPRNAAFVVRLHFHDCFVQVRFLVYFTCIILKSENLIKFVFHVYYVLFLVCFVR